MEKQVVDIDFTGGLNESVRPESLDWTKYLKKAENVTFEEPGVLRARPGIKAISDVDSAGNSYAPIYRLLALSSGLCAVGKDFSLYQYNEVTADPQSLTNGPFLRKNRLPEFSGLEVTTVLGAASKGAGPAGFCKLMGTALTTEYRILLAYTPGNDGRAVLVVTDRYSDNTIRSYPIPGQGPGIGSEVTHILTVVDDRYVHVYSGPDSGFGVTEFRQFDTQNLPVITPPSVAVSNHDRPIGCVHYIGGSAVLMKNGWISKFNTAFAETLTGQVLGYATVGGIDYNVFDGNFYVSGVTAAPVRMLKVLNGITLATIRTVTDTALDVLSTDYCRVAVGRVDSDNAYCYLITYHRNTDWNVAQVDQCSGTAVAFTRVQNMPCWAEHSLPVFLSETNGYYVALQKDARGYGYDGGPTSYNGESVAGSVVLIDLHNDRTWDAISPKPNAFRIVACLDSYVDDASAGLTSAGARQYTCQKPFYWSGGPILNELSLGGLVKGLYDSSVFEFRTLKLRDPSKVSGDTDSISGGVVSSYDGLRVSEFGWVDTPSIKVTPSGAGTLAAGARSYLAVYEFKDFKGKSHFSRCSPVADVVTVGAEDNTVTVTVPTVTNHSILHPDWASGSIFMTSQFGAVIRIYRTVSGGTQYFLWETLDFSWLMTLGADSVTFTDSTADADLEGEALLYRQPGTPGTALDRYHALAGGHVLRMKDRVFYCRDKDIFYSSFAVDGEAPWFSPAFRITVAAGDGPIVGLAQMDGLLIAFKRNSIHVIDGDGPPENGGNGTEFSPPRQLAVDYGCVDARSIINTPVGIMFRSTRGIELLDRSLSLKGFLGERVYRTLDANPYMGGCAFDRTTGRCFFPVGAEINQGIISPSADGYTLVYEFQSNTWSTYGYTNEYGSNNGMQDIVCANVANSDGVWLSTDLLWHEEGVVDLPFGGTGSFVQMDIETGWIKSQSKQDRIKVTDLFLAGLNIQQDSFVVRVSYAVDYNTVYGAFKDWDPTTLRFVQFESQPPREEAQAMTFKVKTMAPDGVFTGRQLDIFGLSVRLAYKGGGAKIPAAQKG